MKTALFDFHLPESLIAQQPAAPRDSARMLAVTDHLHDQYIRDLLHYLRPGDVMVFNDTRVIPARLFGKRGEAKVEVLLHKLYARHPEREAEGSLRSLTYVRDDKENIDDATIKISQFLSENGVDYLRVHNIRRHKLEVL